MTYGLYDGWEDITRIAVPLITHNYTDFCLCGIASEPAELCDSEPFMIHSG